MEIDRKLIVKFKPGATAGDATALERLNAILGEPVFVQAAALFPGEADEALASMYVAQMTGAATAGQVIEWLNKADEIDYAHIPSGRSGSGQ